MNDLVIAVQGCCHGELETIYASILESEQRTGVKVDVLLVCGDFESVREPIDLDSMAVPDKYKHMNSFRDYYTGAKVAPVLTIFIGGNHEASNVLQPLYYGGFVAPNIFFLGYSSIVRVGLSPKQTLSIGGITGIFKPEHFQWAHHEQPPYSEGAKRSVYHIREFECWKLQHYSQTLQSVPSSTISGFGPSCDIFLSHDWPGGIWDYGDRAGLLRRKPFLATDIQSGRLGAPPLWLSLIHI